MIILYNNDKDNDNHDKDNNRFIGKHACRHVQLHVRLGLSLLL